MKMMAMAICLLLLGCSGDNQFDTGARLSTPQTALRAASDEIPSIDDDTDRMFYEYISSPIYKEVNALMSEFSEDLNYKGNVADINTEEKLFRWIEGNLHQTRFNSISEAKHRHTIIADLHQQKMQRYPHIYDYIFTAPLEVVQRTLYKWLAEQRVADNNLKCREDFKNCTKSATDEYAMTMRLIADSDWDDKSSFYNSLSICYRKNMIVCSNAYDICLNNKR